VQNILIWECLLENIELIHWHNSPRSNLCGQAGHYLKQKTMGISFNDTENRHNILLSNSMAHPGFEGWQKQVII
jgi:hypothetical protein